MPKEDPFVSPALRKALAVHARADHRRALLQLADTALPFLALWGLMVASLAGPYWVTLLLAVPTAGLFVRLFIIQHDCGHGSFFASRTANHLVGASLGILTLVPYGYWKKTHAIHHASSGNLDRRELGDIRTITVREYRALSPWRRLGYRLYRSPAALFLVGPAYQFLLKHRCPWDLPFAWKREWASVLWTNLGIALSLGGLVWALGWRAVVAVHLPVVLMAGAIGVWLFYVQHQFESTYWERREEWDFAAAAFVGSSYYDLPRVLHWFSGNIGYHHIHHLASQVPNYHLRACYEGVPELRRHVTRLTLRQSLRCARLKLWDEERRTLVGFGASSAA